MIVFTKQEQYEMFKEKLDSLPHEIIHELWSEWFGGVKLCVKIL